MYDATTRRRDDTRAAKQDCTRKQSADGAQCRCYARQRVYEIQAGNAVVLLEAGKRLFKNSPRTRSVGVSVEISFPFECDSPFSISPSVSSSALPLLGVVSRLSLPLTRRTNSGLVSPPPCRSSSSPAYFHPPPPECTHAYLEVRGCLSRQIPKLLTNVFRGKHSRPLRATYFKSIFC